MKDFSLHIFLAIWEYRQFSNLKKNVPENLIVCVMDFAENVTTKYQDECHVFTVTANIKEWDFGFVLT
jgi:hypothetical protein